METYIKLEKLGEVCIDYFEMTPPLLTFHYWVDARALAEGTQRLWSPLLWRFSKTIWACS